VSLNELKRWQLALQAHEQALSIYQALGDRPNMSASLNHIGIVSRNLGNFDQAVAALEEAIHIKQAIGDQRGLASVLVNMALVRVAQENWLEVKRIAEQIGAQSEFEAFDEPLATADYLLGLSSAQEKDIANTAKFFSRALLRAWRFNRVFAQRIQNSISRFFESTVGKSGGSEVTALKRQVARIVRQQMQNIHIENPEELLNFLIEIEK